MGETTASQYAEKLKDSAPMEGCQTMEMSQESPWSLYPESHEQPAMFFFVPPGEQTVYQVIVKQLADPYLLTVLKP
jgi:hypothetical protein